MHKYDIGLHYSTCNIVICAIIFGILLFHVWYFLKKLMIPLYQTYQKYYDLLLGSFGSALTQDADVVGASDAVGAVGGTAIGTWSFCAGGMTTLSRAMSSSNQWREYRWSANESWFFCQTLFAGIVHSVWQACKNRCQFGCTIDYFQKSTLLANSRVCFFKTADAAPTSKNIELLTD